MATVFDDFIQLPADGTGKRTHAVQHLALNYNNAGGNTFAVGDRVTGASSNFIGDVVFSQVITSNLGAVLLRPVFGSTVFSTIANEDLLVEGSPVAKADDGGIPLYGQKVHVSGANNPFNGQFVDKKGAAYVRFDEGPQQLDAFGLSRFTTPSQLGDYSFEYGDDDNKFFVATNGAGVSTPLYDESAIELAVGTANGDSVTRTTNRYHIYQAGFGQLIEMTTICGDSGKANNIRRWGYFDDDNGVFFELDGTTLNVVIRSSTGGTDPVEVKIPQDEWNVDRVDGSGNLLNLSGHTIDLTSVNIFWIDLAWLGAGQVRFGMYADGQRLTLHKEEYGNITVPYTQTATLPLRWQNLNVGTTAGPTTMKCVCATVKTEGELVPEFQKRLEKSSYITDTIELGGDTSGEYYVGTWRSAQMVGPKLNRKISVPEFFHYHVENAPVIFRIYRNCVLDNAADFQVVEDSAVEVDIAAQIQSFGHFMFPIFASPGCDNVPAPQNFGYLGQHMRLRADGAPGESYTITAEPRGPIGSENPMVSFGMTWIDMG